VPETISASFFDLVLHGKVGKDWGTTFREAFEALNKPAYGTAVDYRKPPARPSPPLPSEAYVGTYGNAYIGAIEVREKGGALLLRLGPKQTSFPLRHWDRDVFLYQPVGEMAAGCDLPGWARPQGDARRRREPGHSRPGQVHSRAGRAVMENDAGRGKGDIAGT
jgi:hypothetical protein